MLSRAARALARRVPSGARGMGGGPVDQSRAVTYEGVTIMDADPVMKTVAVVVGTTMWCVTDGQRQRQSAGKHAAAAAGRVRLCGVLAPRPRPPLAWHRARPRPSPA